MKPHACIFCQGSGLSKEHFWPDWLRSYIDIGENDKHISELHRSEGNAPSTLERKTERPGNVITKKFRVVCADCNSGWMSHLEERVKPFLVAVLEGKKHSLGKEDVNVLSRWVAMKIMVSEFAEDGTQLTPENDRYAFFENQIIPSYFRIYIGRHTLNDKSAYVRHSATISASESGPVSEMGELRRNTQTVCFLIGPIVFYVISCREEDIKIWRFFKLNLFKCIFPFKKKQLNWRALKPINQRSLAHIANVLNDLISSPMAKYGGPHPT